MRHILSRINVFIFPYNVRRKFLIKRISVLQIFTRITFVIVPDLVDILEIPVLTDASCLQEVYLGLSVNNNGRPI